MKFGLAAHLRLLAEYNEWMNVRLYEAAAKLTDDVRKRDVGAFFPSLHLTLDHLLWVDRGWAVRWLGWAGPITPFGVPLFMDFTAMSAERRKLDGEIRAYFSEVDEASFDQPYTLASVIYGDTRTLPKWLWAMHWFNHQTHHRGQATTLLMQLGVDPGVTDLVRMPSLG